MISNLPPVSLLASPTRSICAPLGWGHLNMFEENTFGGFFYLEHHLSNRPSLAGSLTHSLVLQARHCFTLGQMFELLQDIIVFLSMLKIPPQWTRRHGPTLDPRPLSLVCRAPEESHKGCHSHWNQGGEKAKRKKTKVPLTTFGVPASPCCFFM